MQPFQSVDFNEPHDVYGYDNPNTSPQRQRRTDFVGFSRPSSSSGSATHSLRRTPNIEDLQHTPHAPPLRSRSSPPERRRPQQPTVRFAVEEVPIRDQASSAQTDPRASRGQYRATPHPALRISRRTASAILSALESIRAPHTFTTDQGEENAQMSDLASSTGGPRATNGGARAQGPVPVTQGGQTPGRSQVTTPRDIMRRREERKAQAEANARAQQEAERAATAAVAPQPPQSQQVPSQSSGQRRTSGGVPARVSEEYAYPTYSRPPQPQAGSSTAGGPVSSPQSQQQPPVDPTSPYRPRASSQSQAQPRPAQASSGIPPNGTSRPPVQPTQPAAAGPSQPRPTQPAAASSSARPVGASGAEVGHRATASGGTTSSFPHAFERWETLSSHWEGLTSYWIRKLEQNPEELQRQPLLNQLSRQVTDLSAAGANLFHAVVELQRLRASSERKFQRWFYESRKEQERQQEITAELEALLLAERQARAKDMSRLQGEIDRTQRSEKQGQTLVSEIRRELQISKDEARRAWEELGRREQEERDRTVALREGQPIVIGGVQVFPTVQQPGQEAMPLYDAATQGADAPQEPYEEGQSPTNTDPFIETGPPRHGLHHEPPTLSTGVQQPYPPESAFARSDSTARTAIRTSAAEPYVTTTGPYQPGPSTITVSGTEPFYQHGNTYIHNTGDQAAQGGASDDHSYVPSEGGFTEEEEYETDEYGRILPRRGLRSEASDEEDVAEQIEHEHQLRQQYGGRPIVDYPVVPPLSSSTTAPPPAPTIPTSYEEPSSPESSRRRPQVVPTTISTTAAATVARPTAPLTPDYAGEAYGSPQDTRHYYPTRLSDVPEEDERSRVSEVTQGGTSESR